MKKPYRAPQIRSTLNIFDKVQITVEGKTFPNIFVKFIDPKVEMCLSSEEAELIGRTLILRAEAINAQLKGVAAP